MSELFGDEFVPNIEGHQYHPRWIKANPGEAGKWARYRDDLLAGKKPAPPSMATKYGQALIAAGKMSVTDIGSAPPPVEPPPGEAGLPWAPPVLSNPVQWIMTNANRQSTALVNGNNRDLEIISGEALTGPVYQIGGGGGGPWRNVKWIGGKITDTGAGDHHALSIAATGTVHLEGLDIRCDGDALASKGGSATCVWQVQNCRHEVHFNGEPYEHADCFQLQGGTKIDQLRFYNCTMITDYQGFMLRFPDAAAYMNSGDFRRLNFRRRIAGSDPAQAYIFIPDEDMAGTGHAAGQPQIGNTAMQDVWIEATHSSANSVLYPSWLFEGFHSGIGPYGNKEGLFKLTDAQGQYVRPSTTADVVPPGGSASGQQCESAGWTGIIRMQLGAPPGGDFCPAGVAGVNYVSPGYE